MHGTDPSSDLTDRVGGPAMVARLVDELYAEMLLDDRLADYFSGYSLQRVAERQRRFLLALLRAPELSADADLAAAHAPLRDRGLDGSHVDAMLALLERALTAVGIDAQTSTLLLERVERFRHVVVGAAQSAERDAAERRG